VCVCACENSFLPFNLLCFYSRITNGTTKRKTGSFLTRYLSVLQTCQPLILRCDLHRLENLLDFSRDVPFACSFNSRQQADNLSPETALQNTYKFNSWLRAVVTLVQLLLNGKSSVCSWRDSPPVGQGLLIHEISRSHTTTNHSR
jgi:hypothetical protein